MVGALLAVAVAGSPAWALPPEAPAAPTVAAGNAQIEVTFSAPASDGGSPITAYNATCTSSDGGASGSLANGGTETPIVVPGLTNGKTYTCTVDATNADGTSAESEPSAEAIPATVPSAPARPTATRGNAKLTVSFTPPASNGRAITSYAAICSGGYLPVSASRASSPIVVNGLTNGTSYTCRVKATNEIGTGHASAPSLPVVPAAVPDAPAKPTVLRGIGKIVVRFSAPPNNGAKITGYTATCSALHGATRSSSGPNSPITVTGVTNGRTYTCVVTATSAAGTGHPSASSAATVPGTAPAPPTIVSVVSGHAPGPVGPLMVGFKAGDNRGTPISSYRASCVPLGGGVERANTSTGSPITVPSLSTGKAYACRVTATSASGTSGPSGALSTTVGAPAIPSGVTIKARAHGLTLTFVYPSDNSNPILHYHALCKSTNGGAPASQFAHGSPFVVNGLTPGGRYTCRLTAINLRGEGPAITVGPVRVPY